MITRARFEAHADSHDHVRQELLAAWETLHGRTGGEWTVEDEQTIDSKDGAWGRLTMRRNNGRAQV